MSGKEAENSRSFVVAVYARVFHLLAAITPFSLLRIAIPWLKQRDRSYVVVEVWVLGNLAVAFLATSIAYCRPGSITITILLIYGIWRTFEIIVVQMNVLFFDEWRARMSGKQYSLKGYRRIALLLMHNYGEIVLWFMAVLITMHHAAHVEIADPRFLATFRASLLSMVSFSSGDIRALDSVASAVLAVQSVIGIFMTILTLSRFISLIPAPLSKDEAEQ